MSAQLPGNNPPATLHQAAIESKLIPSDDPMEFLRLNRKPPQDLVPTAPPSPAQLDSQTKLTSQTQPLAPPQAPEPGQPHVGDDDEFVKDLMSQIKPAEAPTVEPVEPTPGELTSATEEEPTLLEQITGKKTKDDSIRDLRKKSTELQKTVTERDTLIQSLNDRVQKFEKGEEISEPVQQKLQRIEQLEHFERVHSLKTSREYIEEYEQPFEQSKVQAATLAEKYKVDVEVLDEALEISDERERNKYLKQQFGDDVAVIEVKAALQNVEATHARMIEAEKKPVESLRTAREQLQAREAQLEVRRLDGLKNTSRAGWIQAESELTTSGKYPELKITGDPANDKISKEILNRAAQEYGKTVRLLAANGTRELPADVAAILAKRFLMSEAAAVMAESRAQHFQRAEEVLESTKRKNGYLRPPIGVSNHGAPAGAAPTRTQTPEEAADKVLAQVLSGKR